MTIIHWLPYRYSCQLRNRRAELAQYNAPYPQDVFKFLTKLRTQAIRNSINSEKTWV